MDLHKLMSETALKLLMNACDENQEVKLEIKSDSFLLSSYQDKIGTMQHIGLYYPHTDGRDGYISLSIRTKDGSDAGSAHILLDKVKRIDINSDLSKIGYSVIRFDNLTITIKNK